MLQMFSRKATLNNEGILITQVTDSFPSLDIASTDDQ